MPPVPVTRSVRSGDVRLAVREHSPGGDGRPTVVLVHGYPDRQDTWNALVRRLPLEDWHVVTYDVRGAGASDAPADRAGYRTERLVDDLVAVLDSVSADRAHLVGHDWGSVQLWDAVAAEATDERLRGRIASFTSISGPSLDHLAWLSRHRRGREVAMLNQMLHSWYVYAFHLPALPELVWRRAWPRLTRRLERGQGLPEGHWGPELADDAANGLNLYRANVLGRMRAPRRWRTDVPVLVLRPTRDAFLTSVIEDGLEEFCSDVRTERLAAGHWVMVSQPERVAALLVDHVRAHP
jgi:pimeloyl-ACP methyl ester carboxylesterase